ncbi:MAG: C10 family peptidase [Deltaproteobacteria bacterium]|nr:C10 family peptidase [Candidatus Tharpella aukensis]
MAKKIFIVILMASLVTMSTVIYSYAELVSIDEARKVAGNWIRLIIEKKGSWGGADAASLAEIEELKRNGRSIGYIARVYPRGFIVLPLRKELAPIKAYSAVSDLDPDADTGIADIIKGRMESTVNVIESQLGSMVRASSKAIGDILETNYQNVWDEMIGNQEDPAVRSSVDASVRMNYQGGNGVDNHLIHSSWHQSAPYNEMCRDVNCSNTGNGKYLVGCVALAAAQIMDYWNWPPYGAPIIPFKDWNDWKNMPDTLSLTSPQIEIDAVAELCRETGMGLYMDYGCDVSLAYYKHIVPLYTDYYRYSGYADRLQRINSPIPGVSWTSTQWFQIMKDQFNLNRPIQYQIKDHSIVADGWQEIGDPPLMQYHMNYGWGLEGTCQDGCNAWYTVDQLHQVSSGGNPLVEDIVRKIFPAQAFVEPLSGTYPMIDSFPYRYFTQDATGDSATFQSGQFLQFLEGITVTNTSTSDGTFRFEGNVFGSTMLFAGGDTSKGIKIIKGAIVLSRQGSIKFK